MTTTEPLPSANYLDNCNRCLVTSDLHLGDGSRLEDFEFDDGFKAWLDGLSADAIPVSETVLVLNGDVVDFATIEIDSNQLATGLPSFLLWTESTSVQKLEVAIAQHRVFFDGLAAFHANGGSIVVNVGNHDLDWVWDEVKATLRRRLDAVDSGRVFFEKVGLSFAGTWIEHGHRFTPENATQDDEHFIHHFEGEDYLERVWGTDFVLTFFNSFHRNNPYANNIKPQLQLVFQGLKNGWFGWKDFARVTAFLARKGIPAAMVTSVALSDDEVDNAALAELFDDPEAQAIIRQRYADLTDEERSEVTELLDSELVKNLERGRRITVDVEDLFAPAEAGDNANGTSSPALGLFRDSREMRAARERIFEGHEHVVFGHSHQIIDGEPIKDTGGKQLWNPGTWIAFLDLHRDEVKTIINHTGVTRAVLQTSDLYVADPCAIEIDRATATPRLVRLAERPGLAGMFSLASNAPATEAAS